MRQIVRLVMEAAIAATNEQKKVPASARRERIHDLERAFKVIDSMLSDPEEPGTILAKEAMAIADFPIYFGDVISRAFYADYATRTGSWTTYTYPDEAPDFRPIRRGRTSEFPTLRKRSERGQTRTQGLSEDWKELSVEEYAEAFGLSWRVIINDDLGEIRNFPSKLLRAALRFEDSFVSNLYDNATTQASLISLGANFYGNLALSVTNVETAWEAFMNRNTPDGYPLNVSPRYIVTHPTKKLKVQEILTGIDTAAEMSSAPRATAGLLEWAADPYIGDPDAWYLVADPADIPTITVLRMRNFTRPQVYIKQPDMIPFNNGSLGTPSWMLGDFESGEIYFQVLDIIGGWDDATYEGVTDFHGIYYSAGG